MSDHGKSNPSSSDPHHQPWEPVHPHIAPWQLYAGILGILMVMTVVTVAVANVDLGAANVAVAVIIATIKASLVVTFFMHLKDDRRFNALLFLGALMFGGVFLAYTLNDTAYRGSLNGINGTKRDYRTGEWAAGTAEGKKGGYLVYEPPAAGEAPAEAHH
ncbi:MAG: cytochrome C oxidase subunit IV family protein [Myxococcales bacterium]|nr:cytochrome C oxidase subunit IV family protein [Myxococcales bacterium]